MRILEPPEVENFESNFRRFESRFPDQDSRHEVAKKLAGNLQVDGIFYVSELQLAAHWAYDTPELKNLARTIYAAGLSLHAFADQPVMAISGSSYEALVSDDPLEESTLSIEFGRIPSSYNRRELTHYFPGRVKTLGWCQGVKAPYVNPSMFISVDEAFRFERKVWDKEPLEPTIEVLPPKDVARGEASEVKVYEAVVPLDEERGGIPGFVTDFEIVYGKQSFLRVAKALQERGMPAIEEKLGLSIDDICTTRYTRDSAKPLKNSSGSVLLGPVAETVAKKVGGLFLPPFGR